MNTRIFFTPDMDAKLLEMRAERAGIRRIGVKVGVSDCVIARRLAELGMPKLTRGGDFTSARAVMA